MNKSTISESSNSLLLYETYSSFSSGTSENQNKQHTISFIEQPSAPKKRKVSFILHHSYINFFLNNINIFVQIDLVNQPGLLEFNQLVLQNIKTIIIPIN